MTLPEVRRYLARNPEKRPRGRALPVDPRAAAKLRRILEEQKEQSIMSNEKQSQGVVTPEHVEQWRQWREEGLSYQAIADRSGFDISYGGVAYHLKKLEKADDQAADDSEAASPPLAPAGVVRDTGTSRGGAIRFPDEPVSTTESIHHVSISQPANVRKVVSPQPVWFEALDLDDLDDVVTALKALTTTAALMGGRVHVQLELEVG